MAHDQRLLVELEAFIHAVVHLEESHPAVEDLAAKLDVLDRVVQLLRLRTGRLENRLRMDRLLAGFSVRTSYDRGALHVGARGEDALPAASWPAPDERSQGELQVPLILYLLHVHRTRTRISDLLVAFLHLVKDDLSPADVETTRTGVTRVTTTTRASARTLRLHGLLADTDRTAYKTWELSVLGLLVAVRLHERGATLSMPQRFLRVSDSSELAHPVSEAVSFLRDPDVVAATLHRVCAAGVDVFDSFGPVIERIAAFCGRLEVQRTSGDLTKAELWSASRELLAAIDEAVPPSALAADVARSFALRDLLGMEM